MDTLVHTENGGALCRSVRRGKVEVGNPAAQTVAPGDVVLIPPGCHQRITGLGNEDLVFLAICTPRFHPEVYEDMDPGPAPAGASPDTE